MAKKKGIRMNRFSWTNPDEIIIIRKKDDPKKEQGPASKSGDKTGSAGSNNAR